MFLPRIFLYIGVLYIKFIYFTYRGEEGSRILVSKRYLTVGSGSNSGVEEVEVNSTYYWKPIQGTSLSLCVVLAQDETESRLESLSSKSTLS